MTPVTLDEFGNALEHIGLMTPEEWTRWVERDQPGTAHSAACRLAEQGVITEFQAAEILSRTEQSLVIGDYLLLNPLGAGGMGQVFRARHRHMERVVAIKVLPPDLTRDPERVRRFQREVRAAARLSHPNIVAAYDARHERGLWCLVMEYVDGSDLAALVRDHGPLPLADAVDAILQAARGLAYAHEEGVVHRDIKPSNLIRDRRGIVRILDMGLARLEATEGLDLELTTTGQVMGTVDYISPEQVTDTHSADARSDLYSLGCTLHRLVVGQPMYRGKTVLERALAHQNHPIPSLRTARPEVPPLLDQVFQKLVSKRPVDRYQSATEVVAALELARASLPAATAKPVTASTAASTRLEATVTLNDVESDGNAATVLGQTGLEPSALNRRRTTPVFWTGLALLVSVASFVGYRFVTWESPVRNLPQPIPAAPEVYKAAEAYKPVPSLISDVPPGGEAALIPAGPPVPAPLTADKTWLDPAEQWGLPVNLGPGVNTADNEDHPTVTHDGLSLILARGRSRGMADLWESTRAHVHEPFGPAVRLTDDVNSPADDTCPFLSPDGLQLWFSSERPLEGRKDVNLWRTVRRSRTAPFARPEPLDSSINVTGPELAPFVTPDGLTLMFARPLPWRLFEATRTSQDVPFAHPRQLPDAGRKGWVSFPRLTADRRTLVFGSDAGGRQELWYATRATLDQDFAVPARLGATGSASVVSGPCLSGDEKTVYYSALATSGEGRMDLWSITRQPIPDSGSNRQLRLNRGAYVIVPKLPLIESGSLTIEAFLAPENSDARDQHLAGWSGPLSLFISRTQKWSFGLAHRDGFRHVEAPFRVSPGQRIHLAGVRDGNSITLYVNGRTVGGLVDRESPLIAAQSPFRIGAPPEKHHFFGLIDELRISNVARYSKDFKPPERHEPDAATIALYHCDEESGIVLHDSSGHGYDGQVTLGEWIPVMPVAEGQP